MERLSGGFINDCYKTSGVVVKEYGNTALVGMDCRSRMTRERIGLGIFGNGHNVAPTLIETTPSSLKQQFIPGSNLEHYPKKEEDFYNAGKLLRQIHTPVKRSFTDTKSYYENRFWKHATKALFILNKEGIAPSNDIQWDKAQEFGTTRVHRDYWLGNVIKGTEGYKAIDWEFHGIGSPYEDFAIADMWIFRVHGGEDAFWQGYGRTPDKDTTEAFLKNKLVEFIARVGYNKYMEEPKDGFYHGKISLLKELYRDER